MEELNDEKVPIDELKDEVDTISPKGFLSIEGLLKLFSS